MGSTTLTTAGNFESPLHALAGITKPDLPSDSLA